MSLVVRGGAFVRSFLARRASLIDPEAVAAFYREIWEEAAREVRAELTPLGEGYCEIRRRERVTRVRENLVMLDHPVTVSLGRAKGLAYRMLSGAGLPVPDHLAFDVLHPRAAVAFLSAARGPCVIKPARGTAGGDGVTTNVTRAGELRRAVFHAGLFTRSLLIERQIEGDCYRLLYLDGRLLDALRRRPPTVVGDGHSTIRALIGNENDRRARCRGASATKRITITPDCRATLRRDGWSLRSVPAAGVAVAVKTASNESSDLDCESVRAQIGAELIDEGARAAAVLGIRLAGLDVITSDPGVSLHRSGGRIIEVNATPGLQYHYQTRNPSDRIRVAIPLLQALLETAAPVPNRARLHALEKEPLRPAVP